MCGIIGYTGSKTVKGILIDGLKRLEYRGYDSAGLAMLRDGDFVMARSVGQVSNLEAQTASIPDVDHQGIAHTRWATHGAPSEANAHPHRTGATVLVHNGIIENHAEIKEELVKQGVRFASQTDTEVFSWLVEHERQALVKASGQPFEKLAEDARAALVRRAAGNAVKKVEGHFAVLFMVQGMTGYLFAVQQGAPMVAAHKAGGGYLASDIQALLSHVDEVSYVPLHGFAQVSPKGVRFFSLKDDRELPVKTDKILWSAEQVEKEGYESFMLKEIHQQPTVVADTISGRLPRDHSEHVLWDHPEEHARIWKGVDRVVLVACGTAYYAAMTAKYWIEKWVGLPVEVDVASEFRYRNPVFGKNDLLGVISQSGETADTLSVLRLAKDRGIRTFAVCNVPGSTIAREADVVYPTKAGPEIGVASTKALMAQLTVLALLAADLALQKGTLTQMPPLARLPHDLSALLDRADEMLKLGAELKSKRTVLFVGRGPMYPVALEGALKLKEITYRHAEGYAAGELKHGPIALVDKDLACVVLAPSDELLPKTLSNVEEIRSRGGFVIGLGEEKNEGFRKICDRYVAMPKCDWSIAPMVYVLPLQLFAYGLAKELGCNIDKPRNLAKSVTVE